MNYLGLVLFFIFSLSCVTAPKVERQNILIIGHRGASGYRPEHTLESYELAIRMGADFIEPDLVMTKDKVLIARHENEISETTDVAAKFPKLKKIKKIDGKEIAGWFTEDLTLKEIKTLRARERLSTRDQSYNGKFEVPTFKEILQLAQKRGHELKRNIGVYPETKHPSYFRSIGLPLEQQVADELKALGWTEKNSPVILQSFELSSLQKLKALVNCRLILLLEDDASVKPEELNTLVPIVYGLGPSKRLVLSNPDLIKEAHKLGLKVHPYTFRSDKPFLADIYKQDYKKEYFQFFDLGVDGVFSDFTDHAINAREEWLKN